MRNLIPLKFVSRLLVIIMVITVLHGVHECAHAMQHYVVSTSDPAVSHSELSASHEPPCTPPAQHKDSDGCDSCINCPCHAPLDVPQLGLNYNPIILSLGFSDPYQYLPEVFLSKFIPPQNLA